jgi:hypothetical protein
MLSERAILKKIMATAQQINAAAAPVGKKTKALCTAKTSTGRPCAAQKCHGTDLCVVHLKQSDHEKAVAALKIEDPLKIAEKISAFCEVALGRGRPVQPEKLCTAKTSSGRPCASQKCHGTDLCGAHLKQTDPEKAMALRVEREAEARHHQTKRATKRKLDAMVFEASVAAKLAEKSAVEKEIV